MADLLTIAVNLLDRCLALVEASDEQDATKRLTGVLGIRPQKSESLAQTELRQAALFARQAAGRLGRSPDQEPKTPGGLHVPGMFVGPGMFGQGSARKAAR